MWYGESNRPNEDVRADAWLRTGGKLPFFRFFAALRAANAHEMNRKMLRNLLKI
jgi:hypothetical protein